MTKAKAKARICRLFQRWCVLCNRPNPDRFDVNIFYQHLVNAGDPALDSRTQGDKWQTVHGWLLSEGLVRRERPLSRRGRLNEPFL